MESHSGIVSTSWLFDNDSCRKLVRDAIQLGTVATTLNGLDDRFNALTTTSTTIVSVLDGSQRNIPSTHNVRPRMRTLNPRA